MVHDRSPATHESPQPGFEWPRYARSLVALDETPAAAFAIGHVVPYAVDQRSQLTLLTVVPTAHAANAAAGVAPEQITEDMERDAAARLRRVAAMLPPDLSVTTTIRHGDAAEEIVKAVGEHAVDLIGMGARGIVLHPPREAEQADD